MKEARNKEEPLPSGARKSRSTFTCFLVLIFFLFSKKSFCYLFFTLLFLWISTMQLTIHKNTPRPDKHPVSQKCDTKNIDQHTSHRKQTKYVKHTSTEKTIFSFFEAMPTVESTHKKQTKHLKHITKTVGNQRQIRCKLGFT